MYRSILIIGFFLFACATEETGVSVSVKNEVIGQIPVELFGHFLEKPSWHGEQGPEAALQPNSYELQEGVVALMQDMHIPLLRFPGGSDVDYMDWTTMIDTPGKLKVKGNRPPVTGHKGDTVGANFGYDEAGKLAEELGASLMLVVNFGDAYKERKPLQEAAMHEAGLLAYCAAPLGADLPGDLEKWPELRAENGHPEPYPVKYVQIANEPFWLDRGVLKIRGDIPDEKEAHFMTCAEAYIDLFKQVLPGVKIILDGNCEDLVDDMKERLGNKVDLVAYHRYYPWAIREVKKGEEIISRDSLTEEEIWNAWAAVPNLDDETGLSVFDDPLYQSAVASGYPVALTEWNWNGWWNTDSVDPDNLGSMYIKGIGVAGFLHAMIRAAADGHLALATQSMLVGNSWGITGIRVSPRVEFDPHLLPTGQVTAFYANHHGGDMLKVELAGNEGYEQPYKMNDLKPEKNVAQLDVIATKSKERLFVNILNRSYSEDLAISLDLSGFLLKNNQAVHKTLYGNIDNEDPCSTQPLRYACINEKELQIVDDQLAITQPARTVGILEIQL